MAIALALDLDRAIPGREAVVASAFGVVVFTLLVQGLSICLVMRRVGLLPTAAQDTASPT